MSPVAVISPRLGHAAELPVWRTAAFTADWRDAGWSDVLHMGAKMMREICAGLSMSSYINNHLAKGRGTGAIIHPTPDQKGKLQVRYGDRGRGLFAMSIIHKGSVMRDVAGSSSNNFHNL